MWLELGGCGFTDMQRTYSQTKLSLSAATWLSYVSRCGLSWVGFTNLQKTNNHSNFEIDRRLSALHTTNVSAAGEVVHQQRGCGLSWVGVASLTCGGHTVTLNCHRLQSAFLTTMCAVMSPAEWVWL